MKNSFKTIAAYIIEAIATIMLWIIFMAVRIVYTPIWTKQITNFKFWRKEDQAEYMRKDFFIVAIVYIIPVIYYLFGTIWTIITLSAYAIFATTVFLRTLYKAKKQQNTPEV